VTGAGPVAILGGSGFIGSRLTEILAGAGRPVRALSRRGLWPGERPPGGVSLHALDLAAADAPERLAPLLAGCPVVVNCSGALLRPGVPDSHYRRLHVDGTRHLLAALADGDGPARLVHVSTTGVLGPTGPHPLDESAPLRPVTVYERTKAEGEALARDGRRPGLEVAVARPGLVYGPGDRHLVALFAAIRSGRFRPIGGGGAVWQPVYVDDVAAGLARMVAAAGVDGGVFHLAGGEAVTVAELAGAIAAELGTRVRRPGLPRAAAWLAGAGLEAVCLPLGLDPPLSRMRVRTLTEHRRYDIGRADRELGWRPRMPLREGLRRTVAWYRDAGLLPAAS
jgi:nucleoside-diphosphate-sugar epimerase